jgi:hypothetical protein
MPLAMPAGEGTPVPPSGATDEASDFVILPIPYVSQRPSTNLCWAACAAMLLAADHLPHASLCEVASVFSLNGENCCPTPSGEACDHPADPEAILSRLPLGYQKAGGHLDPASIQGWIVQAKKPMELYFWLNGPQGDQRAHVALLIGCAANGKVFVNDPWWGAGWLDYNDVVTCYGYGSWYETYYGIGASLGPLPQVA